MSDIINQGLILISACLTGASTRYDARILPIPPQIIALPINRRLIICPEILGGLASPRSPAHFIHARSGQEGIDLLLGHAHLLDIKGRDVSAYFIFGARKALKIAISNKVKEAWLKSHSPSCAYNPLGINSYGYPRQGVLSALLIAHGIKIIEFSV